MPLTILPNNANPSTIRLSMIGEWTWSDLFAINEELHDLILRSKNPVTLIVDMRYSTTHLKDLVHYASKLEFNQQQHFMQIIVVTLNPKIAHLVASINALSKYTECLTVKSLDEEHRLNKLHHSSV